ncbi:hypothetical protein Cadr_000007240 [Camelus dromedarius]|uniref:Uncharacterized protein n=1 Tax=Camelus dromedarius TaxID=9838 RepID=A0A5N4E7T6_CAMDR|nr:hypothetical protein Cadr_000007240 [Camelus dromedarius]
MLLRKQPHVGLQAAVRGGQVPPLLPADRTNLNPRCSDSTLITPAPCSPPLTLGTVLGSQQGSNKCPGEIWKGILSRERAERADAKADRRPGVQSKGWGWRRGWRQRS